MSCANSSKCVQICNQSDEMTFGLHYGRTTGNQPWPWPWQMWRDNVEEKKTNFTFNQGLKVNREVTSRKNLSLLTNIITKFNYPTLITSKNFCSPWKWLSILSLFWAEVAKKKGKGIILPFSPFGPFWPSVSVWQTTKRMGWIGWQEKEKEKKKEKKTVFGFGRLGTQTSLVNWWSGLWKKRERMGWIGQLMN